MGRVAITHLGLAAYLKMKGVELAKVEAKTFIFVSDRSLNDWRVEYNNSCCMLHDTMVCELRHFIKSST